MARRGLSCARIGWHVPEPLAKGVVHAGRRDLAWVAPALGGTSLSLWRRAWWDWFARSRSAMLLTCSQWVPTSRQPEPSDESLRSQIRQAVLYEDTLDVSTSPAMHAS